MTIEERADFNANAMGLVGLAKSHVVEALIEFGKEQEQITMRETIDKACDWLRNNLGYYDRHEVHIGKSYEEVVIDDFRKAMEE